MLTWDEVYAFLQVVWINLALSGDNAIVIGMAAAGLPEKIRTKAIFYGIGAAVVLRIGFAIITTHLLEIVGLLLAGGLLLLWVSWKLWREIQVQRAERAHEDSEESLGNIETGGEKKSFKDALIQIVIADLSMSLDNVLAVAGAARLHTWILIAGLALSVLLMALAANLIAALLKRYHWIAFVGLAVILYVACAMIYDGGLEVLHAAEAGEIF